MGVRSSVLQGLRLDAYRYILDNPGCTRRDVALGLGIPNNVATARIKELIDEGYVYEPGDRKRNPSGVMAKTLVASDKPEDREPVRRVKVVVTLHMDHGGNYVPKVRMLDPNEQGGTTLGYGVPVAEKVFSIPVKFDNTTTTVSRSEIVDLPGDIIDAEYTVDYDT